MPEICVFHHIPKTAGSALREILQKNYEGDRFVDLYLQPEDTDYFREYLPTVPVGTRMCLASHTIAAALPALVEQERDFKAIVVLRDPVDRIISLYYFVLGLPTTQSGRGVRVANVIRERGWELKDIYAHFGGTSPAESDIHRDFSVFFDFQARSFLLPWRGVDELGFQEEVHEGVIPEVADLLDRYYVAGVQDRFGEALKKFAAVFDWSLPFRAAKRKVNVGAKRPKRREVDDETVAVIRRYNATDFALYDLVSTM